MPVAWHVRDGYLSRIIRADVDHSIEATKCEDSGVPIRRKRYGRQPCFHLYSCASAAGRAWRSMPCPLPCGNSDRSARDREWASRHLDGRSSDIPSSSNIRRVSAIRSLADCKSVSCGQRSPFQRSADDAVLGAGRSASREARRVSSPVAQSNDPSKTLSYRPRR